jgi:hypothetical protein
MKQPFYPSLRLFLFALLLVSKSSAFSQDNVKLQIVSPFDSIKLRDVKAIGNLQTGAVEVTMQIQSDFHKLASLTFSGGAFDDFGLIDDKGVKYKYSTYSGPSATDNGANKGYSTIAHLQLGKSKAAILISVQDTFRLGQSKTLQFLLPSVDKSVKTLKEAHILCHLMLDYMSAGQKQFFLRNIPVEWINSKPKPSVK